MQFVELVHFLSGADGLAKFEGDQVADEPIAEKKRKKKGGDCRTETAERDVLEHIQCFE